MKVFSQLMMRAKSDYKIVNGQLVWANPNLYLEGDGEAYIDTGIQTSSTLKIDIEYYRVEGGVFGYYGTIGGVNKSFFYPSTSASAYARIGAWYVTNNTAWANESWLHLQMERGRTNCKINDTVFSNQSGTQNEFSEGATMWLFLYRGSSTPTPMTGKIKYFKVYDGDTLLMHLVPVPTGLVIGNFTVTSNGMFDIVSQTFFGNVSTGAFGYGKV